MEERAVIDRVVDDQLAVLLIGDLEHEVVVPVAMLPAGAGEGARVLAQLEVVGVTLDADGDGGAGARIEDKVDQLRRRGGRLGPDA